MNPSERIQRYLQGTATGGEVAELDRLLAQDPALRRKLIAEVGIDAALRQVAQERAAEPSVEVVRRSTLVAWRPFAAAAAAAAAVVVFTGLGWWLAPASTPALGTITQILHAEVSGADTALVVGQRLDAGRFSLARGAVAITLSNGVTLLYEGPGEIELLSPMRALLHSGQVVVRVPKNAVGFQMDAASARVVDLGTEFAMKAGPGLETDVQVFEGAVVASPSQGGFAQRLAAGTAARYTPQVSSPKPLAYAPARFLRKLPLQPGIPVPGNDPRPQFRVADHSEAVIPAADSRIRVDGDLSDWGEEGRFFSERDSARSVDGRMRHDAEAFYVAAHVRDPAPMRSGVDPCMDGESGWRGGGVQVRLSLDRAAGWPVDANGPIYYRLRKLSADAGDIARAANERLVTMTFWHHAPSDAGCLHLAFGVDFHGGIVNPQGGTVVFKRDGDDTGYTLEARVPWEAMRAQDDPPQAGDALAVCWNTHWADPSGRAWLTNLIEMRNPAEPPRIYDFERAATWGRAIYR